MNKTLLSIFLCFFFWAYWIFHLDQKKDLVKKFTDPSKEFVSVEYRGQLGNCLFQTAAAISHALENNCQLCMPPKCKKRNHLKHILWRIPFHKKTRKTKIIYDQSPPFNYEKIPNMKDVRIVGYFESEHFFKTHKKEIVQLFQASRKEKAYLMTKHRKILTHPQSVGIHIRSFYKDWLVNPAHFFKSFPAPDLAFIKQAMMQFDENALFFVCSDHIPWCKKFLKDIPRKIIFIENQKTYHDFFLLTQCKHLIMSNSTFSWWAAYLNENPQKKVFVRTPWFMNPNRKSEDIIVDNWQVIAKDTAIPVPDFSF